MKQTICIIFLNKKTIFTLSKLVKTEFPINNEEEYMNEKKHRAKSKQGPSPKTESYKIHQHLFSLTLISFRFILFDFIWNP